MRMSSESPPSPLLSRPLGAQSRPPPVKSGCTATTPLIQQRCVLFSRHSCMRQSFELPVSLLLSPLLRVQVSPVFMQETVLPDLPYRQKSAGLTEKSM